MPLVLFRALPQALKLNTSLTEVDLSHNSLCGLAHGIVKYEASGIELLANALTSNRALTALNVLGNELDKDAARMLAAIAKARRVSLCGIGPTQKHVNFYYKGLKAPDAILIAADLQIRPALTILELPSNEVGPDGAVAVDPAAAGTDPVGLLAAECPVAYELTRPSPI